MILYRVQSGVSSLRYSSEGRPTQFRRSGTYFPRIWWPYDMRVSEHFQVRLCLFLDMETRGQKHNQDGA